MKWLYYECISAKLDKIAFLWQSTLYKTDLQEDWKEKITMVRNLCLKWLNTPLATAEVPGMSKGEQGVENQFKGINLLSSPEPLKQL